MSTQKQIDANRENAQHSTGATSESGKLASARNHFKHGLCQTEQFFEILPDENPEKFDTLAAAFQEEYEPQDLIETLLVRRMAEYEWLRARALRYQTRCLCADPTGIAPQLALLLRYQTTHERSFYKALAELKKHRAEKTNAEIGFESQQLKQAADTRAAEALNLRKDVFQFRKEAWAFKKSLAQPAPLAHTPAEINPGDLQMAA
jgi:hypothetical protein